MQARRQKPQAVVYCLRRLFQIWTFGYASECTNKIVVSNHGQTTKIVFMDIDLRNDSSIVCNSSDDYLTIKGICGN